MLTYWETLIARKSNITVSDSYAALWGKKSQNNYTVETYTGTLPATLTGTKVGHLESYKIYGSTVQDGTPTPENPIVPSGCGERTAQIISLPYYSQAGTIDGITWTIGTDGKVTGSGITERGTNFYLSPYRSAFPLKAGTYTLSFQGTYNGMYLIFRNVTKNVNIVNILSGYSTFTLTEDIPETDILSIYFNTSNADRSVNIDGYLVLNEGQTPLPYEPYGYKLPLTANGVEYPIYLDDAQLAKDEYVDSATGKIYKRTKNLSPPEEEWVDEWIWGDGTIHPSTEIKTSPFIDVSTCEACIMEVFSTETKWAATGYRKMAFYDENKQYLGWIGGGGRQTLTPNPSEDLSEFPAGTVYVRIGCSHGDQPFYPQLVSGYTPTHQFYPYLVPTDPPAPFPQIPTAAGTTVIDYDGEPKPDKVEFVYKLKG